MDCYAAGEPVVRLNLATADTRWPRFPSEAVAAGFGSVRALLLRLRGRTIGALNLFGTDQGTLDAGSRRSDTPGPSGTPPEPARCQF